MPITFMFEAICISNIFEEIDFKAFDVSKFCVSCNCL